MIYPNIRAFVMVGVGVKPEVTDLSEGLGGTVQA